MQKAAMVCLVDVTVFTEFTRMTRKEIEIYDMIPIPAVFNHMVHLSSLAIFV